MHILLIVPDSTPTRTIASRILDILSFYHFIGLCFRQGVSKNKQLSCDCIRLEDHHHYTFICCNSLVSTHPICRSNSFLKYSDIEQA